MPPSRSMSWPPTPQIDQMAKNHKKYEKVNEKSIKSFKECIKSLKERVRMREEDIEFFKAYLKADEQIRNKQKKKTTETARSQIAV